jgi:hypothetical protein
MLTFLRPARSVAALIYAARTAKATAEIVEVTPTSTRLVQRGVIAGEETCLIDGRAECKQHMESQIARCHGHAANQYECGVRQQILQSQRSQAVFAL